MRLCESLKSREMRGVSRQAMSDQFYGMLGGGSCEKLIRCGSILSVDWLFLHAEDCHMLALILLHGQSSRFSFSLGDAVCGMNN
jgi:hypothetical protein